jgi:hypothetical protein
MRMTADDMTKAPSVWKSYTVAQLAERHKERKSFVTLKLLFTGNFSDSEINRLNSYLPAGVAKF